MLREVLAKPGIQVMPCCYDAFSAKLIEQAGFAMTFMSGFAVSAARLALPDTGLISYGEMVDQGASICNAVSIPVFGDGDTGYGNELNVQRTVHGYARAGLAGIMIEDQVAPKRCGHTRVRQVVDRDEAVRRIRAAAEATNGSDILIMARTDARTTHGMEEALWRAREFVACGADIIFLEALTSEEEMREFCDSIPGYKMANLVEDGKTPLLSPAQLEDIGYKIAAYPVTLLSAAAKAMTSALSSLKEGHRPEGLLPFTDLQKILGFEEYFTEEMRWQADKKPANLGEDCGQG